MYVYAYVCMCIRSLLQLPKITRHPPSLQKPGRTPLNKDPGMPLNTIEYNPNSQNFESN